MRAFLALVVFEIQERKALLAAAVVASILPVLAPILASTGKNPPEDIREVAMWVMVGCLVPLLGLLLGVTFIGRDLSEKRMGFYFAQPLSGWKIWFGKLTAVVVLVLGTQVLIVLPTTLLSPDPMRLLAAGWIVEFPITKWLAPLVLWVMPVAIVLVAHALGIVWRARSAWLVVDLVAGVAVLVGAWFALSPFVPNIAPVAGFIGGLSLVPWVLAGLVIGGAVQVTAGRVDPRRCHRMLSLTFWPVVLSAVGMVAGWSWWVRTASPDDLNRIHDVATGSGDWIAVVGQSRGRADYRPRFLLNTADGRWMAAGTGERWYFGSRVDFSADMSRAVWAVREGLGDWRVMIVDLGVAEPRPRSTGVVVNPRIDDLAVSENGDRFAVIQGRTVSVFDGESGDQLAAARFDDEFIPQWAIFEDAFTIRIEARTPWKTPINDVLYKTFRLDVEAKELSDDGSTRRSWRRWVVERATAPNRRLVEVTSSENERLMLIDDASGEHVADLGTMPDWRDVRLVEGEKILVARDENEEHHLEIFDADGQVLNRIELEPMGEIYIGGEVSPGRFAIGMVTWHSEYEGGHVYRTVVVDLPSAAVVSDVSGYRPLLGWWGGFSSTGAWEQGAVATRLLVSEAETLHTWNPENGQVSSLVPGEA